MKKIFLTSGLVLCMACPAMAETPDLEYDNGVWSPAMGENNTNCVDTYLGTSSDGATVAFDPKFEANTYTITYYGGTAKNGSVTRPVSGSVNQSIVFDETGQTVKANAGEGGTGFSILGYSFTGWRANKVMGTGANPATELSEDHTSGGQEYAANDPISPKYQVVGGTSVYAQWSANPHTITYNPGSGTGTAVVQNVHYDDVNVALKSIGSDAGQANFSKEGYHFAGWQTSSNFSDTTGQSPTLQSPVTLGTAGSGNADWSVGVIDQYILDANATLVAQWVANGYTVTYECGGLTVNSVNHSASYTTAGETQHVYNVTFDGSATASKTVAQMCTFTGYTTTGWSCVDNSTGATVATPFGGTEGAYNHAGSVTCTAQWEQNTINLQWYNAAGTLIDTTDSDAASCDYDGAISLPNNPGKDGYTFKGWTVRTVTNPGA